MIPVPACIAPLRSAYECLGLILQDAGCLWANMPKMTETTHTPLEEYPKNECDGCSSIAFIFGIS